ncbi:hypothetical protein AWC36_11125 [Brenneria goodwinii]|nr:hypothetical protein AWC36_11125 [Brenneria goodwinii]
MIKRVYISRHLINMHGHLTMKNTFFYLIFEWRLAGNQPNYISIVTYFMGEYSIFSEILLII